MRLAGEIIPGHARDLPAPGRNMTSGFPADPDSHPITNRDLDKYIGVLWPGCNLTVYHFGDNRVATHLDLAKRVYEAGIPQFGTCWGIQLAIVAAGGEVGPNPKGREDGNRPEDLPDRRGPETSHVTRASRPYLNGFVSHDDEVTKLPPVRHIVGQQRFQPSPRGVRHLQNAARSGLSNIIPNTIFTRWRV